MMEYEPDWSREYHLLMLDCVDSTNLEAKRLIQAGVKDNYFIWAKTQRQGRGREGRVWISPEGNFYGSLLLEISHPLEKITQLTFVAAVAVRKAVVTCFPALNPSLKWPNDLLIDDKKVAGILLESLLGHTHSSSPKLIIGVGINLHACPTGIERPVTTLSEAAGSQTVSVGDMAGAFIKAWQSAYTLWQQEGFNAIRSYWLEYALGKEKALTVATQNSRISGIFKGIDEEGSLILELASGDKYIVRTGEVFLSGGEECY